MNQTDITALYHKIFALIKENRFREAYSQLFYLIQQNSLGALFDELNTQETTYRYLLHYSLEGVQDQQQEQVLYNMRREMMHIADKAYRGWQQAYSPRWYYSQMRYRQMNGDVLPSLPELKRLMRDCQDEMPLLEVSKNNFVTTPRRQELQKIQASCEAVFFQCVLFSDFWKESDKDVYRDVFVQMSLPGRAMAVSAFLLSLQELFDEHKFSFLMELCQDGEMQVRMRALTALLILLLQHDERLSYYPALKAQLSLVLDNPNIVSTMPVIYAQLLREKFNYLITKKMQDELLPEMNKLSESLQDKLEGQEKISIDKEDLNELFSDSGMSDAMQEFSDLQMQGEDVYMSTFSQMKFYPFFKDIYHWFVPFYLEHPQMTKIFGKDTAKGLGLLKVVTSSMFLCDSDKYSFCLNMTQVPEQYRASMISNMGADSEQFKEMMDMEQNGSQQLKAESVSNLYIQDIYRFYQLFPSHRDFYNIFQTPMDVFSVQSLKPIFMEEDNLKKLAALLLKKQQYEAASRLYGHLLSESPDSYEYLRSLAYCHEKQQHFNQAIDAYRKADLVRGDVPWLLKRLAYCCKQVDDYTQALACYQRLSALEPDKQSHLMHLANCHLQMKDYDAALNAYYKIDFLFGESSKTWRPLAWCSLRKGQYEQAGKYYDKILQDNPDMNDYLCYGHLFVAQAQYAKAIDAYEQAYKVSALSLKDFYSRFDKDWRELSIFGLDKKQMALLSDALKYRIEEKA